MNKAEFERFAQKVRAGNEQLFNQFLIEEYEKCKRGLRSLISSEEERHDLIIDAIYKFRKDYIDTQRLELKSETANPSGCIYQMARHKWLTNKRTEQTKRKYADAFKAKELEREKVDDGEEKEQLMSLEEDERLLHKAVELLKEKCRELIKKHWFERIPLQQLWKPMGTTAGSIRVKHSQCKKSLAKLFMQLNGNKL